MKSQPISPIATRVAIETTPVAAPRRPNRRSSRSTAGLSASARNTMTTSTVRGRKKTSRSRSAGTACSIAGGSDDRFRRMSLRGRTVEHTATLPDGRHVVVHVGVPEDPYIRRSELETVDVELHSGGHVLAAVNTVLDPD